MRNGWFWLVQVAAAVETALLLVAGVILRDAEALTLAFVMLLTLGWIFFRANDLRQALDMFAAILSPASYVQHSLPPNFYVLITVVVVGYFISVALPPLQREQSTGICAWLPVELKCALYGAVFYLAVLHNAEPQQFIYFQF